RDLKKLISSQAMKIAIFFFWSFSGNKKDLMKISLNGSAGFMLSIKTAIGKFDDASSKSVLKKL
ncbi:hypothetical protein, partial [Candidatus Kryptobacter tengchongensis]|uniref:hypothetical protein n=1 Tax=Kryptobacter tengchongensis TaxID=1643429 RepID=UPI0007079C34